MLVERERETEREKKKKKKRAGFEKKKDGSFGFASGVERRMDGSLIVEGEGEGGMDTGTRKNA